MSLLKTKKPLLLYGMQRAGTTIFYNILAEYLRQTENLAGLGEVFAIRALEVWDTGKSVGVRSYQELERPSREEAKEDHRENLEDRLKVIQKYHGDIFFKITTGQVLDVQLEWFSQNYEWVFVERKNIFELALSFCTSMLADRWYRPGGLALERGSLEATSEVMGLFERNYISYLKWRKKVPSTKICVYEDFIQTFDCRQLLKSLGLHTAFDDSLIQLPEKQNIDDKLSYFKNPETLVSAYRHTFLNDIYPANS